MRLDSKDVRGGKNLGKDLPFLWFLDLKKTGTNIFLRPPKELKRKNLLPFF